MTGAGDINGAGNSLANVLRGNFGDNILSGGSGADRMAGGKGNDTFVVDNAADMVTEYAGEGIDTVLASTGFTLGANVENLTFTGWGHINGVGNGLANVLRGSAGNNRLARQDGSDTLAGYRGNDTLAGGRGNDILAGGTGKDAFVFDTTLNAVINRDTIVDFVAADDVIHLDNAIFTRLGANGALNAGFFRAGATAADADDRILYDRTTGALRYDGDGSGSGVAVQFATLTTKPTITAADFLVI